MSSTLGEDIDIEFEVLYAQIKLLMDYLGLEFIYGSLHDAIPDGVRRKENDEKN